MVNDVTLFLQFEGAAVSQGQLVQATCTCLTCTRHAIAPAGYRANFTVTLRDDLVVLSSRIAWMQ